MEINLNCRHNNCYYAVFYDGMFFRELADDDALIEWCSRTTTVNKERFTFARVTCKLGELHSVESFIEANKKFVKNDQL